MNQDSSNQRYNKEREREDLLRKIAIRVNTNLVPEYDDPFEEHPEPTPDNDEKTNRVYDYGATNDKLMRDNEVLMITLLEILKINNY